MKKAVLRDNLRKTKINSQGAKNLHSQSPPHKKLLKKIESTHQNAATHKYDFSLQDKLIHHEHKEEAQDFRVEIERRYQKSFPNKEFRFPLHRSASSDSHSQASSNESSFDSLRHVTVYDLASQNKHRKSARPIQKSNNYTTERVSTYQGGDDSAIASSKSNFIDFDDDFSDDIPIEIQIKDKTSAAYKKVIALLESNSMFSHNSTNPRHENRDKNEAPAQRNPNPKPESQTRVQNRNYNGTECGHNFLIPDPQEQERRDIREVRGKNYNIPVSGNGAQTGNSQNTSHNHIANGKNLRSTNVASYTKVDAHINRQATSRDVQKSSILMDFSSPINSNAHHREDRNLISSAQSSRPESNLKKTLSYDKVHHMKVDSASLIDRSLGGYSTNGNSRTKTTFIDTGKLSQESLKKIYNNNILKSITPQYTNMKNQGNQIFSRDGMFKSYNNEGFRAQTALGTSPGYIDSSSFGIPSSKTPLSSLYQRAQNDVLSNKLGRVSSNNDQNRESGTNLGAQIKTNVSLKQLSNSGLGAMLLNSKRDETPKGPNRKIALNAYNVNNIYTSPEQHVDKYGQVNVSSSQNKLSKKNSVKALQIVSPAKKASNEKTIYTSYDFSQANGLKKPTFKLDLTNRNQGHIRDTLSSARIRNKTAEKFPIETEKEVMSRTVIDHNPVLNGSISKTSTKKGFGHLIPTNKLR